MPISGLATAAADAQSLTDRKTHEDELLEQALRILERAGVPASSREVKFRSDLTLDQVIVESKESDYDLMVTGAVAAADEAWPELRELVQQNLTERVRKAAKRPVTVAREAAGGLDWGEFWGAVLTRWRPGDEVECQ